MTKPASRQRKTSGPANDTDRGQHHPLSGAERWQAVVARDHSVAHRFVYAVRSTGIYCRAGCPSRRPRREQVSFHPDPVAAEREGFRACKRCRPREVLRPREQAALVERVWRLIEQAEANGRRLSLAALGKEVGMSPGHLQRVFSRETGLSPRAVAAALRAGKFRQALREAGGGGVSRAVYQAGYGSPSRVYEGRHDELGMTPATYQAGGKGVVVKYMTAASPLGRVIVAGTERGVCFVALGQSDGELTQALAEEFPAAVREKGGDRLRQWTGQVVDQVAGAAPAADLPLDIQGTAFQRRVWAELRKIPAGETWTYTDVARRIGKPRAVRAVASACASNNVAVVIPCHRVVRTDGGLGGYRWGLERKRKLLAAEGGSD